jgi:PAS domain S-box-containing protein
MNQLRFAQPVEGGTDAQRTIENLAALGTEENFRQLLEALPAAIFTTDAQGRITFYNRAAAELAGREPVLGVDNWCVTWRLYRPDGTLLPHDECPMAITLREDRALSGIEAIAERPDGTRVPFLAYPSPIHDASGRLIGAVKMMLDISDRKQAEDKVRALMGELNHRVKNNMQMLQSLLGAAEREATSPEAREALGDAVRQVGAMAAAQQGMYSASTTEFDARSFLEALCRNASQSFGRRADIQIGEASGQLTNDAAIPLALILNELVTNAVKHGKGERSRVTVSVALARIGEQWELRVQDDGPGFEYREPRRRASGLGLVSGLARQLGGRFEISSAGGAQCIVRFGGPRTAD